MREVALKGLLETLRARFKTAGVDTPDLDARLLVGEVLGLDRAGMILRENDVVAQKDIERLEALTIRRLRGEPVGRILGRRFFYDHEFRLSPETLEPRPDTEILVELSAQAFRSRNGLESGVFADVGTGTGAIAISLLALFPNATAVAIDLSEGALRTALRNAGDAGVSNRFTALRADFLSTFAEGTLDAIVSNPPYIPSRDVDALDVSVREHDPRLALDGGPDGLHAYRAIALGAARCLKENGDLLLEIGIGQEADVRVICEAAGFSWQETRRDLSGIARALWFCRDADVNFAVS